MTPKVDRAVALFWLALSACACLLTSWAARTLGAGWRLSTALGLFAGLCMLVIAGRCLTWGER